MAVDTRQQIGFKIKQINHPDHKRIHGVDLLQYSITVNALLHTDDHIIIMPDTEAALTIVCLHFRCISDCGGITALQYDTAALTYLITHHTLLYEAALLFAAAEIRYFQKND